MKVSFYNAVAGPLAVIGAIEEPDSNLLIHVCRIGALPQADEVVSVAGSVWFVQVVVHLVGPGDDYEARVWLRPAR